ncbi:hypothetical protein VOLCADRAFT_85812 [Volvox carteri f. nagariensis]|uniref:Prenyltransferase alpha-alpha toroid domain-containing protein n=1 Tax=Volvox carteri f. nagariensis TaxID=3068 RepID=D8TH22_VOLCA|nr:uncharacterized protein VOLCADRAFT_85812 [Volvox carteri f. nagariensis]EFJ52997.1 hypothetical protein VOLCADRAFT_85812 [Volvox carteri f. nagariensis]|eukprot:XP_002946002.1 hypothetical protein VOLCADRAFT_85812 [Volvox carteri f. nagariensis]
MFEDRLPTATSKTQNALEKKVLQLYQDLEPVDADELHDFLELHRDSHIAYIQSGLGQLGSGFAVLDASRTWIVFWLLHSLALLDAPLPRDVTVDDIIAFLSTCQHPGGGFGGGPMQLAHLAPTYAAVAATVTLGGKALGLVDRAKLRDFLFRMCIPPEQGGGFSVHEGGEGDLRACYTAMAVTHMVALEEGDKQELLARSGMVEYIRACQTYEGGLGGEPGNEAHGGYSFCGVAALMLAGGPSLVSSTLDVPRLLHWLGSIEGGFNGRTNKLVDGCYSFWQGGIFPLLAQLPLSALRPPPVPAAQAPREVLQTPPAPMMTASPPFELAFSSPQDFGCNQLLQHAEGEMHARMHAYEALRGRALAASDEADGALRGAAARHSAGKAAAARELLDQAAAAHEAAELATTKLACINVAAFNICPPPDPEVLAIQEREHLRSMELRQQAQQQQAQQEGQAGQAQAEAPQGQQGQQPPGEAAAGAAAAPPQQPPPQPVLPPPLCNYEALQLWILKCCQATKGGLRDKPGKPVDYYHTCYCLSGLSAAQHAPGSHLMGHRETNLLRRADPAVNVVEDKLAAARTYYTARPLPALATPMPLG